MNTEQTNLISTDVPESDFEQFLIDEGNRRIFFSGKFGIGKTYFLQKFFEGHKDKYDVYHLFPVRYQISSNENVVELLKYDILIELLKQYPDAFKTNGTKGINGSFKLFAAFCKDRGLIHRFLESAVETGEGVLALSPDPLFQVLGKLGRPLNDLLKLDRDFQTFKKEYLSGDKGVVEKFIKEIEAEKEATATDYISHLLHHKISELKGSKRSVLILDDFERVDPDHIFRILNVMSAHMEVDEENKFGFDHVIIVGDIHNIQNIFSHKYGDKTEFDGYFNKFFTVKPYEFDNAKAIAESIPLLLQQIKHGEASLKVAFSPSGIVKHLMEEVLGRAFAIREMDLRQLYKPINHLFPEVREGSYTQDHFSDSWNKSIDIGIKLLIALYAGEANFLRVLKKIRDKASPSDIEGALSYREYSNSMLRRIVALKPGMKMSWKKYTIAATQDENSSNRVDIYLEGEAKAHARFFYDVLVEYTEQEKYKKQSRFEYER